MVYLTLWNLLEVPLFTERVLKHCELSGLLTNYRT